MKNYFLGLLLGAGAILPGISSGVFCVVFGIYERLINSILHFFSDIKKNFLFLFPIFLGVITGVYLFSNVLQYVYNKFFIITSYTFIGLILGGIPLIFKKLELKKINIFHILCFLITFSFSLYLVVLESSLLNNIVSNYSTSYLILSGILMSAGLVIPGISKSVILMMLNIYPTYLSAISTFNFSVLIPIGIGLAIGSLIFLYLLDFLFHFFKSYTYFGIIGFIIGSTFVVYPGFCFSFEYIIGIIFSLLSFCLINFFGKQ